MASFLKKAFVGSIILDRVCLVVTGPLQTSLREEGFPSLRFEIGFPERPNTTNSTLRLQYYWMQFIAVWIDSHNGTEIYEVRDDLFNTLVKGKSMGYSFVHWRVAEDTRASINVVCKDDTSLPSGANGIHSYYGKICKEWYCPMIDDDLPPNTETYHAKCGSGDATICCRIRTRGRFNDWLEVRDFLRTVPEPTRFSELSEEVSERISEKLFALLFED